MKVANLQTESRDWWRVALLRCPTCLHVQFVTTAGPHACPSCDHGRPATVAPRLPIQSKQELDDVYYQEACRQLEDERLGRAPVAAAFGVPAQPKTARPARPSWSERRAARKAAKAAASSTSAEKAPVSDAVPTAQADAPTAKAPKEPKAAKAPRQPGTSKRNWFAKTSFGTAWGAFILVAAVSLGAITRLEAEAGFTFEEFLGVPLEGAIGWPTIVLAVVAGLLGIFWAKRNPQAKGMVRSVFGIVLAIALAATFFIEVSDFVDPVLAP